MTVNEIVVNVSNYVESVLLPKMSGTNVLLNMAMYGSVALLSPALLYQYKQRKQILLALGIVDEEDNVNSDNLKLFIDGAFKAEGVLPVDLGKYGLDKAFDFNKQDVLSALGLG